MNPVPEELQPLFIAFHDLTIKKEDLGELWDEYMTTDPHYYLPEDHPHMIESKNRKQ